jgi:DnaJ-class molecular chaperone
MKDIGTFISTTEHCYPGKKVCGLSLEEWLKEMNKCDRCNGSGFDLSDSQVYCLKCKGSGKK